MKRCLDLLFLVVLTAATLLRVTAYELNNRPLPVARSAPTPAPTATPEFTPTPQPVPTPAPPPDLSGRLYYWGSDTGWAIGQHDGYTWLGIPSQDFYIAKVGCGGWRGEECGNLEQVAIPDRKAVFAPDEPPLEGFFVYWYLHGPTEEYIRDPRYGTVDPTEYGAEQAQKFYSTYNLQFRGNSWGNTLFVDVEPGSWVVPDSVMMQHRQESWDTWRRNVKVLDGFLNELRYLTHGEMQIGVYTGPYLRDMMGPEYEFPFPVVLWYAAYPTAEMVVCCVSLSEVKLNNIDPPPDNDLVSINPLRIRLSDSSIAYQALMGYIQTFDPFTQYQAGGYLPVIWQFCNNQGDVAIQNPLHGFTPRPLGK